MNTMRRMRILFSHRSLSSPPPPHHRLRLSGSENSNSFVVKLTYFVSRFTIYVGAVFNSHFNCFLKISWFIDARYWQSLVFDWKIFHAHAQRRIRWCQERVECVLCTQFWLKSMTIWKSSSINCSFLFFYVFVDCIEILCPIRLIRISRSKRENTIYFLPIYGLVVLYTNYIFVIIIISYAHIIHAYQFGPFQFFFRFASFSPKITSNTSAKKNGYWSWSFQIYAR